MFIIVAPRTDDSPGIYYATKESDIPSCLQKAAEKSRLTIPGLIEEAKIGELSTKTKRFGLVEQWVPASEMIQLTCSLIPKEESVES